MVKKISTWLRKILRSDRIIPAPILWFNIFLFSVLLIYSVYRDIQLEKQYPGDLRNRQVGARLIKDGKLPYFYKWKQGDDIRYYDPNNADSFKVSIITATPFFHRILEPVCNLPFSVFSKLWLLLQYICLFIILLTIVLLCKTTFNKLIVLNIGIAFTYTEAWIMNARYGQIYLLFAAIFSIIAYLLIKYKQVVPLLLAGLLIASFILMRPIAVVMMIPFLLFFKKNVRLLLFTALFGLAYGIFIMAYPFEKSLWKDYSDGLAEQVKIHQNQNPSLQKNDKIIPLHNLEGFNMDKANMLSLNNYQANKSENGNVFHLYYLYKGRFMPLYILNSLWGITMLICCIYYYMVSRRYPFNIEAALIFGYTLYMLTEIFSPIHRHQYNTVQWLPALILTFTFMRSFNNTAFWLMMAGLILNISNTHLLPMRHTIGEFLILFGLLLAVYKQTAILNVRQNNSVE